MKELVDYYVVPKFAWNDFADAGYVKAGRLICTKKYVFLLIEKEDFSKNLTYDPIKVDNLLMNAEIIDVVDFEFELFDIIPDPYIIKIENLEFFNTNNNFITGGLHFRVKGQEDAISIDISKRQVRKDVVDFYNACTFG